MHEQIVNANLMEEPVEPTSALRSIRGFTRAARNLAQRLNPESESKEDLLNTLSAVEVAVMRLQVEMELDGGVANQPRTNEYTL
jgi:hypothetical protein